MALFQLDPASIAARASASGEAASPSTFGASMARGIVGFTILSVAGFLPWPILDLWIRHGSEMELYITCTAIFIGLSGPCLHRLIIGPGSLARFYKLFSLAFVAYAAVWIAGWMLLRESMGLLAASVAANLGGTAAMGVILALAFDATAAMPKVIFVLFVCHAAGYYAADKLEGLLGVDHRRAAMFVWAVCYGIGFGAGLGAALHFCQERARALFVPSPSPQR